MRSLVIIALLATTAAAQTDATVLNYRVQKGDTLDVLAAEFYADRNDAIFIMVENKMKRPRALNPGERIHIPVTRDIRTEKGDTFESLAQRYLGDA
jgi:LysM repeat protein